MSHLDMTQDSISHISLEYAVLRYLIINLFKNKIANQNVPKDVSKTIPCKNHEDRLDGLTFIHVAICGKQDWK